MGTRAPSSVSVKTDDLAARLAAARSVAAARLHHMFSSSSSATAVSAGITPALSASYIVAEEVTGSHVLKIEGYSRTKGLGVGKCINSGTFNVGGHAWCISYYPDGYSSNEANWISIFLRLNRADPPDPNKGVKARFCFSLLDQAGNPVPLYTKDSETMLTFCTKQQEWGYSRFIERKALEESTYLRDDCFRVRWHITVTEDIRTEATSHFDVVPPSDMQQHLGRLLSSGEGADVTFEVGGEAFTAHRSVLAARSSVFMAELLGPMKERTMAHIRIDDMEARVFKALLHFVYTDSLPDEGDKTVMAQHLLVAADRYNLERLKLICENKLCNHIDTSTAATTLAVAEQHGCRRLKEACFTFLKSPGNLKAAMASDGFEHLASSCPSILIELLAKIAP